MLKEGKPIWWRWWRPGTRHATTCEVRQRNQLACIRRQGVFSVKQLHGNNALINSPWCLRQSVIHVTSWMILQFPSSISERIDQTSFHSRVRPQISSVSEPSSPVKLDLCYCNTLPFATCCFFWTFDHTVCTVACDYNCSHFHIVIYLIPRVLLLPMNQQ